MMMSTRFGISNIKPIVLPLGYYSVFSLRKWNPNFVGTLLRLRTVTGGLISDFGFKEDFIDVPAIINWANGSEIEIVEHSDQYGNLVMTEVAGIPPMRLVINLDDPDGIIAKIVTTVNDGMIIKDIPYTKLKILGSHYGLTQRDQALIFCSRGLSTTQPRIYQLWWEHKKFVFGVNTSYSLPFVGNYEAYRKQVVVFNNDVINGETSIRNHKNFGHSENSNISYGNIDLGIGMAEDGSLKGNGDLGELVITYDSSILLDVENTLKTNIGL